MNKPEIIAAVIAQLQDKVTTLESAMAQTVDAATNEQTVPEHKYDTLALEASYLAHGQAVRLQQIHADIKRLEQLVAHSEKSMDKVALACIVEVEDENDKRQRFMMLPCAGGIKLPQFALTTVTPESPLGKKLHNKQLDDEVEVQVGERSVYYAIVALH
ncbi:GreA/GreB family elongation factor [Vibrio hippocampi]|uniref:Transcription elongation factor GreA n=1 Tax=Vibrio hippocampi TaxID=654686 RepID=A0ABM8ZIS0_9VIBR|nr:GreA/GreB family elongation factor [Vibrio hippocampi]CAH0526711.1 Transcription elongation factor GreA [Vibrio hippocampi]